MKKILSLLLLNFILSSFCTVILFARGNGNPKNANEESDATASLVVSIAPLAFVVEYISDNTIPVYSLVEEKESPETYVLSARELFLLEQADVFFSFGSSRERESIFEFEKELISWLQNKNPSLVLVELAKDVELLPIHDTLVDLASTTEEDQHDHLEEDQHDHLEEDQHDHSYDIHMWLSPDILEKIAMQVHAVLTQQYPQKAALFQERYQSFLGELQTLRQELLVQSEKENFVFIMHPSLGYLSELLSFKQISLEYLGRERSLRDFSRIEMLLERYKISTLYTEPTYSSGLIETLVDRYNLQVIPIDPLKKNVLQNIRELARMLQDNF